MGEELVYSGEEMKAKYGSFYDSGSRLTLDQRRIPQKLWPSIPYASFWGVSDDVDREILADNAPTEVQRNLKAVVAAFDDLLDEWLAGEEAANPKPSREYIAFSAMRMAADYMQPD